MDRVGNEESAISSLQELAKGTIPLKRPAISATAYNALSLLSNLGATLHHQRQNAAMLAYPKSDASKESITNMSQMVILQRSMLQNRKQQLESLSCKSVASRNVQIKSEPSLERVPAVTEGFGSSLLFTNKRKRMQNLIAPAVPAQTQPVLPCSVKVVGDWSFVLQPTTFQTSSEKPVFNEMYYRNCKGKVSEEKSF